MASHGIQWTDATWNPTRGCSVVSPGCVNCYAMKQAHRFSGKGKPYEGLTKQTKAGPQWTGRVVLDEETLRKPLTWKTPKRVFVNSMSDLFHESLPDEFIDAVFAVMARCPQHQFQVLTKRADRLRAYGARFAHDWRLCGPGGEHIVGMAPLSNVWLGVSVETQPYADERIPLLLQTPAAVRFISAEPLLGLITLDGRHSGLNWVIVGGESGPGARPCEIAWIRSIVRQCQAAGVPCFVKQVGADPHDAAAERDDMCAREAWPAGWMPKQDGYRVWRVDLTDAKGGDPAEWPADLRVREYPR